MDSPSSPHSSRHFRSAYTVGCALAVLAVVWAAFNSTYFFLRYFGICWLLSFLLCLVNEVRALRQGQGTLKVSISLVDKLGGWPGKLIALDMLGYREHDHLNAEFHAALDYVTRIWTIVLGILVALFTCIFILSVFVAGVQAGMKFTPLQRQQLN